MAIIKYEPSPTGVKFHQSKKVVRCFTGPVGNGTTAACINELLMLAFDQWPNSSGVRKTRFIIVRNTYPELSTTTLRSWQQWVPETLCPIVMNPVIQGTFKTGLEDGTRIEAEVIFLPLNCDDDVSKLMSLECTAIYLNEAKFLPYSVITGARKRIGRYPAEIDGYTDTATYKAPRGDVWNEKTQDYDIEPCKRKAIIMDTNPPDSQHWWFQLAVNGFLDNTEDRIQAKKDTEELFDFFDGPPPLIKQADGTYLDNPEAENISHLPGGYKYYRDMIAGNMQDDINVNVLGMYGSVKTGKVVYPQFNEVLHVSKDRMFPIEGRSIGLGWDFGLTPTCIIGDITPKGQLRVIAELVGYDIDVRSFARDVVKPYLTKHFSNCEVAFSYGDPSGNFRGEGEGKSAIGILNDEYSDGTEMLNMGFITEPAPTNDPTKRTDAVIRFLSKITSDGKVGFSIDKRCKTLIGGFNGGYCYIKLRVGGSEGKFREKPDKGKFSHCFSGDTKISTPKGFEFIDELKVGDYVCTPIGDRRVIEVFDNGEQQMMQVFLSNGEIMNVTPYHAVFVLGKGMIPINKAEEGDIMESIKGSRGVNIWKMLLFIMGSNTSLTELITEHGIGVKPTLVCIAQLGLSITAKFLRNIISTTSTMMAGTTVSVIYSVSKLPSISVCTAKNLKGLLNQEKLSSLRLLKLQNGTGLRKVWNGTVSMVKNAGKVKKGIFPCRVYVAPSSFLFLLIIKRRLNSAVLTVSRNIEWIQELIMRVGCALFVLPVLLLIDTGLHHHAVKIVGKNYLAGRKKVYNLNVEEANMYYADGVLVFNCHDGLQYLCLGFISEMSKESEDMDSEVEARSSSNLGY